MTAVAAIAAVQARISAIEWQIGVRRPATTGAGDAEPVAPTTDGTTVAATSTTDLASFDDAYAAAIDQLRAGWTTPTTIGAFTDTSTIATTGTTTSATTVNGVRVDGPVSAGTPHAALFEEAGARYGIPPKVLAAMGFVESRFRTDAVSSAGAVGMMQFLPSTAASMGVDPYDPASAIDGAARYLRSSIDRFGSLEAAIASYNVGPGAISRAGGVQPGTQAERYLTKVVEATAQI
ncbi:MAG: transglycosylase SLT domain-containing protein [Acidimicrobiales bacterium]|nr:transglycosylase SLT domain-containing protein [Acidimicrobiales bacterium]MCB9392768.1 transglycosylase SLT domain-containing protein [Acidimicrobiaceae bacterium]